VSDALHRSLSSIPAEWREMIALVKPSLLSMLPDACACFDVPFDDLVVVIGDLRGATARRLAESVLDTEVDANIRAAGVEGSSAVFMNILPPEAWQPFFEDQLPSAIPFIREKPPETLTIAILDGSDHIHVLFVAVAVVPVEALRGSGRSEPN
jgi:hypothetical protein